LPIWLCRIVQRAKFGEVELSQIFAHHGLNGGAAAIDLGSTPNFFSIGTELSVL
jgi:hypothetical protein